MCSAPDCVLHGGKFAPPAGFCLCENARIRVGLCPTAPVLHRVPRRGKTDGFALGHGGRPAPGDVRVCAKAHGFGQKMVETAVQPPFCAATGEGAFRPRDRRGLGLLQQPVAEMAQRRRPRAPARMAEPVAQPAVEAGRRQWFRDDAGRDLVAHEAAGHQPEAQAHGDAPDDALEQIEHRTIEAVQPGHAVALAPAFPDVGRGPVPQQRMPCGIGGAAQHRRGGSAPPAPGGAIRAMSLPAM